MRATIQKLNMALPYCDARSDSDILFVFRPPATGLHLSDVLEFDQTVIESASVARKERSALGGLGPFRGIFSHVQQSPSLVSGRFFSLLYG